MCCREGEPLNALTDNERSRVRARSFGFVFQHAALDPHRSVMDTVLEPSLYVDIRRSDLVERAQALLSTMGVSVTAGSRPAEISGGQAQRVGVARALILQPKVIFADEPTGNLDRGSADVVLQALETAAEQGCTVLIATHDERIVARSTHQIALR
ncbi:MAG: ABC transporter ATP-binding protein [Propioniciclava sp.]